MRDEATSADQLPEAPGEDPAVYEQLRRLALKLMKRERSGHTLQATALVHEAWLRIEEVSEGRDRSREQFLALAARMMRRILVDHARARVTLRRGGGRLRLASEDLPDHVSDRRDIDLLVLNEALERLAAIDEDQVRIVEYRFFGGMTLDEIAVELKLSPRTVDREWKIARTWLFSAMSDPDPSGAPP